MKFKYKGVFLANRSSCSGFESSLNSWKENCGISKTLPKIWDLQQIGKYLKQRCKIPKMALQLIHIMLQTTSLKSLLIHMKINKVWTEISPDVHLASRVFIAFDNMLNSSNDGLLFQILKGKAKFDSVHFVMGNQCLKFEKYATLTAPTFSFTDFTYKFRVFLFIQFKVAYLFLRYIVHQFTEDARYFWFIFFCSMNPEVFLFNNLSEKLRENK